MLKEKAAYYYGQLGKNCAEGLLLAANEMYNLGITEKDIQLFAGFGGGMGCKSTCGSLSGALGILSLLFGNRDNFRDLCGEYVAMFEEKLGTIECKALEEKYRTEADRCVKTVELTAELLEEYINKLNGVRKPVEDTCTLTPEDIKRVKGLGFLQHKGTNKFNGRVITRNGQVTTAEMKAIQEAADLYGDGKVNLTTRLTMEVSGIDYADIDAFRAELAKAGLLTGGTGSKVRPVVSCKGTTCQYGLYDTYELSEEIHRRFYLGYNNVSLPHKFKIATGGCPNNCIKPNLNDVGIAGVRVPNYNSELCKGCKKCQIEAACPIHIAKVADGKLVIDPEVCNNCGRCVGKCPFHCIEDGTYGWKMYIGGRWGKNVAHGHAFTKVFTEREEVLDTIEKIILFFRSEGIPGERLADTVERVGFEKAQEMILSNDLLERKAEILGLNVVGGATC